MNQMPDNPLCSCGTSNLPCLIHNPFKGVMTADFDDPMELISSKELTELRAKLAIAETYGQVCDKQITDLGAEAAALRERERWIPVEERIPEFEEPVWALIPCGHGDNAGYCLAVVMRGDGEEGGWNWHICKDWGGGGNIDWPIDMATADFECDDDYRVKFWLPLKALSAAPERPMESK